MAYNLPKFKMIHINSVRLFLKINLLSEITDHTGTQLLTTSLQQPKPHTDDTYQSHNRSTLVWPRQKSPGKTAWATWKEIIQWIYANNTGVTLSTPLGPWLPQYSANFEWAWSIHPETNALYHHHRHVWYEYSNPRTRPTELVYKVE